MDSTGIKRIFNHPHRFRVALALVATLLFIAAAFLAVRPVFEWYEKKEKRSRKVKPGRKGKLRKRPIHRKKPVRHPPRKLSTFGRGMLPD